MKISIAQGLTEFKAITFDNCYDLSEIIKAFDWSAGVFKDNYRNKANFLEASFIGLDIDENCSLKDALELFKDYQHIITTTKSHQLEKNGVIADRFRVILFFSEPITSNEVFEATWFSLYLRFPFIDRACKDSSRFYYQSIETVSVHEEGLKVEPASVTEDLKAVKRTEMPISETKGLLARATLDFLINGAPEGSWNVSLFKAAKDWSEQGLAEEDFLAKAELITGYLDLKDHSTISSAFKVEPKYHPRGYLEDLVKEVEAEDLIISAQDLYEPMLSYLSDKDLVKGLPTGLKGLDELLGGGKRLGEITAWHAEAKTGKNAVWHFLQTLWFSEGISMGYASRELNPATEVLPDYLSIMTETNARLLDIPEALAEVYRECLSKCSIYFARGLGFMPFEAIVAWVKALKARGVNYFWFDHLHYMLEDPEDHKAAAKLIQNLKSLAGTEMVHFDIIIQPNKLLEGQRLNLNSMKGGSAMGQAIDNLIVLERAKDGANITKLSLQFKRSRLAQIGTIYLQYNSDNLTFVETNRTQMEQALEDETTLRLVTKLSDHL